MYNQTTGSQKITLYLSAELLKRLAVSTTVNYCTRSDYIRAAIVQRLNQENQQQANEKPSAPETVEVIQQTEAEFLKALEERYGHS